MIANFGRFQFDVYLMTNNLLIRKIVFPVILVTLFFVYQYYGKFHFFCIEQFQLFRFSWNYFFEQLSLIGGFSILIGNFLLQFFVVDYLGALISSILTIAIAYTAYSVLLKSGVEERMSLLGIVVAVPFLILHLYDYYNFAGTIGFLISLFSVYLTLVYKGGFPKIRILGYSLILFWISGPFAFQYIVSILIISLVNKEGMKSIITNLMILGLLSGIATIFIFKGYFGEIGFAFLPSYFFEPRLDAPKILLLPYAIFAILLIMLNLTGKQTRNTKNKIIYPFISLIIILSSVAILYKEFPKRLEDTTLKELDYYAKHNQWNSIISVCSGDVFNHCYMNYLNLALLKKGLLTEEMFLYDQRSPLSLSVTYDMTPIVSSLLSDIAFETEQPSLARTLAFEALVNASGSTSGRYLKRLIETNLVLGSEEVVYKYLDILDETLFYRKWSAEYRQYANNNKMLIEHKELGPMIKSLNASNQVSGHNGSINVLIDNVVANPENKKGLEYIVAYLMLSKDLAGIKNFVEKYYGTPVLKELPRSMQEAVIVYSENEPDYWTKYGVSEQVINNFMNFKQFVVQNRGNRNLPTMVKRSFGGTFWYFYMYKS
jgi:hypothetical protein